MPRPKRTAPSTRLNLEMHAEVRTRLEWIKDEIHADSLAEVIRKAVAVYDALLTATREGGTVIVRTDDGVERQVLIPEFRAKALVTELHTSPSHTAEPQLGLHAPS